MSMYTHFGTTRERERKASSTATVMVGIGRPQQLAAIIVVRLDPGPLITKPRNGTTTALPNRQE